MFIIFFLPDNIIAFLHRKAFQEIPVILLFYRNMLCWKNDKATVSIK